MNENTSPSTELEQMQQRIRATGLRCTSARLAVLRELTAASAPLTHAEIADRLVNQGIDKATVFRNLVDLVDAEILTRRELGDHVWRFEVRPEGSHGADRHPHFVCVDCGGVTCLDDIEFNTASRKVTAKVGLVNEILLKGVCRGCE